MPDVIFADRLSDGNQMLLRNVGNLRASWSLSAPGLLTFETTLRELNAAGIDPTTLLSTWVHYEHPTAGHWGGRVTIPDGTDGLYAITCESWAGALVGAPGAEVVNNNLVTHLRISIDINAASTGVRSGTMVSGPSGTSEGVVSPYMDVGGALLPSVISYFTAETFPTDLRGPDWYVDPVTRRIDFSAQYGADKSADVELMDTRDAVSASWSDDLSDLVNMVVYERPYEVRYQSGWTGKGKKRKPRFGTRFVPGSVLGVHQPSIDEHGPRLSPSPIVDDVQVVGTTLDTLRARANGYAQALAVNHQLVTLETVDEAGVWASFREGDIVSFVQGNNGVRGVMLVRHRGLDASRGTMLVSGEAIVE